MKKQRFPLVPPLLLAGVLMILLPIFSLMIFNQLDRQKEFFTQRLIEKGTFLIRTFEAGTRTGMFTMDWGAKRIQTMLYETAFQPEVAYLVIVSENGTVLAHSDASQVGRQFEALPDDLSTIEDEQQIYHRTRKVDGRESVFEVYKQFVPNRRSWGMRRHMMMHPPAPSASGKGHMGQDWSRVYTAQDGAPADQARHYLFAGLSMAKEHLARQQLVRQTIWQGGLLFGIGCAGVVALFVFQAYRGAQASLSRVKAFSDTVIHHMPSGLITMDTQNRITSMNAAAKQILGQDSDALFPRWMEMLQQMRTSLRTISKEIVVEISASRTVLLDVTASPIMDEEGQLTGFLFLFKDLTQVKELKKQVETNKRLAAIGKLAAGVAHEIRNPLSSIKGFATYFGQRYRENKRDQQTAQVMVSEVERINRSITQLLEFAKPMAVEKKPVDIHQMLSHSLTLVQYDLDEKNIQVMVDVATREPEIQTDADRMNQVLLNLYINAIQAMDNSGTLSVSAVDADQDGWIEIRVKDNGCGIDADVLDLIFDPYYTSRPSGTGLGLSIVHRIIENLSGRIQVESTKGSGTVFTISLPTDQKDATP